MSSFYDNYKNPELFLDKLAKCSHYELSFKKRFHKNLPLPYFKFMQERACSFESNKIKVRSSQFFLTTTKQRQV